MNLKTHFVAAALALTLMSVGHAQTYVGLNTGVVADGGLVFGIQASTAITRELGVRALAESNFSSNIFLSAEAFYTPHLPTATWQGYYGGGLTVTWLENSLENRTFLAPLITVTAGVLYKTGDVSFFGEARTLIFLVIPALELRAGINYHFD